MKKNLLSFLFALLPALLAAQVQLETKNFRISDFCERTLDVVLTGNSVLDAVFREEMPNVWNISPYEFCTQEQFEARKRSRDYYFLMVTDTVFGKQEDASIKSLTIFNGDPLAAAGTDRLYRVATIPFCSAEGNDGRELAYLPALVDILQKQIEDILDRKINIGDMARAKAFNKLSVWPKPVLIAEEDKPAPAEGWTRGKKLVIVDADAVDEAVRSRDSRYLVTYCVDTFTMVIDAQTHELYYLQHRKAGGKGKSKNLF